MQVGETCTAPVDLTRHLHSDKSAGAFTVSIRVMITLFRSEKADHSAVPVSKSWKEIAVVCSAPEHQPVSICSLQWWFHGSRCSFTDIRRSKHNVL